MPTRVPILALASLIAAGCGGGSSETMYPVAGSIAIEGKPLTTGSVSLRATKGNATQHHPTGEIDAQGRYEMYTSGRKGAPPGWYKVLIFADENRLAKGPVHPAMPKWLTHTKYTSETTTDLYLEVVARPESNRYDLKASK